MDSVAIRPADRRMDGDRSPAPSGVAGLGYRPVSEPGILLSPWSPPGEQGPDFDVPAVRADRFYAAGWRHNLPQPLTSFIGREQEIVEARRLLEATRLLTLTGTGGVGKTRLGHEVAATLLDQFHGGVWIVELAALADPALVPQAVATVLDVREEADCSLTATLAAVLRPERLLLVLDNCEHLIEACAALADTLLRACPDLRILATSRQALGIDGETTFHVPSLSLSADWGWSMVAAPGEDATAELASRASSAGEPIACSPRSEAVRLFVERARAAVRAFTLTDRSAASVEEICQRLDGIPLAIELAAARVAVLTPEQIAARLGDRFHLLSGGSRTALPRYRTLRAMLDWSHDLLDEQERVLLRRLAVFAGGWTLEAAERVCAGDGLDPDQILDLLSGLVAKSLVLTAEHADEVRYRFLESLRAYAAEKLRDAGEEIVLRQQHRDWCVTLAERAESELRGPDPGGWLDRLERERENVRTALAWCIERDEAEPGLRMAGGLARFWQIRGPYREIRAVLAELLALPAAKQASATVQAARAKALIVAGRLAMRQDDRDVADALYQEALELSQECGDQRGLARALVSIGRVARVRGDYATSRQYHAEAIPVLEALGDDFWLAHVHHDLGVSAFFQGDLATARQQYEACLALFERLGDELGIVTALEELGEVAFSQGDHEMALALLGTTLERARGIDDKERIAMALAALAGMAAAQGRPRRALRLAAAATAITEATEQCNSPAWYAMLDRWLEPARRTLTAEACAAAQAAGRAMPLDAAIEYALSSDEPSLDAAVADVPTLVEPRPRPRLVVAPPPASAWTVVDRSPVATTDLTPRELEVAALVARGLTNRQIAAELVIAEGTAANHVKHILARLLLDSRAQIAVWAVEHGLHRPCPS